MQLHLLDALLKGLLLGLFMAISVGPTLFAVIKYSLNLSYKAGLAFILGVSFSDIMFVTIANIAATWLRFLEAYERTIAFVGAAVLMAIGIRGLIKKEKPKRPSATAVTITGGHYARIWTSGFLVNTLNPGAIITWLGAVTLTASSPGLYRAVLFGTCLCIILSIDFSKVLLADKIKRLLTIRRIIYLHRISALCLFLIGSVLLLSTVFNLQFRKHKKASKIDKILSYTPQDLKAQQALVSLRPHV